MSDLTAVADGLYGVLPARFTAERTAAVKQVKSEGDKTLAGDVGRLSKPSVAAWAVNALVRERRDLMDGFLALGESLREAQEDLDSDALRTLAQQRRRVVEQLAGEAQRLGTELGQAVSQAAREDVERTLQAALADADAAAAVMTGRLVRALTTSGFDPVDLDGAVAGDPARPASRTSGTGSASTSEKTGPPATKPTRNDIEEARRKREQELEERRRESEDASRALDEARAAYDEVVSRREEAQSTRDQTRHRLDELQAEVERLTDDLARQSSLVRRLGAEEEDAEDAAARAERAAGRAAERLAALEERIRGSRDRSRRG